MIVWWQSCLKHSSCVEEDWGLEGRLVISSCPLPLLRYSYIRGPGMSTWYPRLTWYHLHLFEQEKALWSLALHCTPELLALNTHKKTSVRLSSLTSAFDRIRTKGGMNVYANGAKVSLSPTIRSGKWVLNYWRQPSHGSCAPRWTFHLSVVYMRQSIKILGAYASLEKKEKEGKKMYYWVSRMVMICAKQSTK